VRYGTVKIDEITELKGDLHEKEAVHKITSPSDDVKVEKKTEEGKTVYEAVINKNGKERSIEVDANGKFLKRHKEAKEKESENY
jgi:uncharacterized membrane protein YkoI